MKKSSSGFFAKFRLKPSPKPKHKVLKVETERRESKGNANCEEAILNTERHEERLNTELDRKEYPAKPCIKLEGRQPHGVSQTADNMEKHEVR